MAPLRLLNSLTPLLVVSTIPHVSGYTRAGSSSSRGTTDHDLAGSSSSNLHREDVVQDRGPLLDEDEETPILDVSMLTLGERKAGEEDEEEEIILGDEDEEPAAGAGTTRDLMLEEVVEEPEELSPAELMQQVGRFQVQTCTSRL